MKSRWIVPVAIFVLVAGIALMQPTTEKRVRIGGLALQLSGTAMIVLGIQGLQKKIKQATGSFASHWQREIKGYAMITEAGDYVIAGGQATPTHGILEDASPEDRIRFLQAKQQELENQLNAAVERINELKRDLKQAFANEQTGRQEAIKEMRQDLEGAADRDVVWSVCGLAGIFLGLILSTASAELVQWLLSV